MIAYFKLQYRILNRKLDEIGFSPILGYVLAIIGFYGISVYLFSKTEFAEYFYGLVSISFISKLSEKRRNDFLKTIFSINDYRKLRILENLILAFPFLVFLLYKQSFLITLLLFSVSVLFSLLHVNTSLSFTIPTPFSKKPFEFPVGFRKTFYFFPIAYFLTYQSILVENFNLGVASMLLIVVVILSYYSKPENEFYVWSFKLSARGFLLSKIMTGLIYFTFLSLPILISLIGFFPNKASTLIVFLVLGYVYITTIILAKYSAYPNEMNLPEAVLIGISLMFPPILLGITPLFYTKSIKRLKPFLEND